MTLIDALWRWLLALVCCLATECSAKDITNEDVRMISWQPDPYIISEANTSWGKETNHVKAGLNIQYASDSTGHTLVGFVVVLYYNGNTNGNVTLVLGVTNRSVMADCFSLMLPPLSSRYQMTLFDEKGNIVAKTKTGESLSQRLDTKPSKVDMYHGYVNVCPFPSKLDVLPSDKVVLEDCFDITNAGIYHLKFVLNTLKWTDDQGNQPFYLPVDANIEIKKP